MDISHVHVHFRSCNIHELLHHQFVTETTSYWTSNPESIEREHLGTLSRRHQGRNRQKLDILQHNERWQHAILQLKTQIQINQRLQNRIIRRLFEHYIYRWRRQSPDGGLAAFRITVRDKEFRRKGKDPKCRGPCLLVQHKSGPSNDHPATRPWFVIFHIIVIHPAEHLRPSYQHAVPALIQRRYLLNDIRPCLNPLQRGIVHLVRPRLWTGQPG